MTNGPHQRSTRHVSAVGWTGTLPTGFPITLSRAGQQVTTSPRCRSGVLIVGTDSSRVLFIDSSAATVFKAYAFGNTTITGISRDAGTGRLMVATSDGKMFLVAMEADPASGSP